VYKKYNDDEYKENRKQLDVLFYNEHDYSECLKRTKDFLQLIKDKKASDYNFFFTYMMFSKIYNNLGDKDRALTYVKLSTKYLYQYRDEKFLSILNKWQYAMIYKQLNKNKAINYFHHCYMIAISEKMYELASGLMEEIALIDNSIENSIQNMKFAIELYIEKAEVMKHIDKQNRLDEMYSNLFCLYIKNNDTFNAYKTLHNIKNETIINNLKLEAIKSA
jgi:hypothetical protein